MGGDILTFLSPPGSTNRRGHYSYLSLHVWHSGAFVRSPQKKKEKKKVCHAVWMNTSWLQVCVCCLAPQRLGVLIRLLHFPWFPPLILHPLHLSSRNTDDPEVSLQLQCQLHRPPHLGVHALATEDGAGTPEPPAGQPRGHGNQHGYMHGCELSGKIWGGQALP